jgi:hypothetical protein
MRTLNVELRNRLYDTDHAYEVISEHLRNSSWFLWLSQGQGYHINTTIGRLLYGDLQAVTGKLFSYFRDSFSMAENPVTPGFVQYG